MFNSATAQQDCTFFDLAQQRNVIFYHMGYFSHHIISAMAEVVKLQLEISGVSGPTRRKLFSSFVELSQNIIHYSSDALNTSVFIPYAVYADGNIIKVFSEHHHRRMDDDHTQVFVKVTQHYDKRWILCERPNIQVGGELTLEMLEVNHSDHNRVWNAPLQMMANNGILVIDDLGRQSISVAALLNRWIVPMEYFVDHLALPNGQHISVPFTLTLAFSSNLSPSSIADPAFLRRLGYKIEFNPLEEAEYLELWSEMATTMDIEVEPLSITTLLALHNENNVEFFPCLPKDLLGISRDILTFEGGSSLVSPDILVRAWGLYFTTD